MAPSPERELGTLVVVVLKAQNLVDRHSFYKQDVYATVSLSNAPVASGVGMIGATPFTFPAKSNTATDGKTQRTHVDLKGGQHPVWDDELRFPVRGKGRTLEVACWAKEHKGDECLGRGTLDITDTLRTGEFDEWVKLEREPGTFRGELYLEMTFFTNAPAPLTRRPSKLAPKVRLLRGPQSEHPNTQPTRGRADGVDPGQSPKYAAPTRPQPVTTPASLSPGRPPQSSPGMAPPSAPSAYPSRAQNTYQAPSTSPHRSHLAPPSSSPSSSASSSAHTSPRASPHGRDAALPPVPEADYPPVALQPHGLGGGRGGVAGPGAGGHLPSILRPGNARAPSPLPPPQPSPPYAGFGFSEPLRYTGYTGPLVVQPTAIPDPILDDLPDPYLQARYQTPLPLPGSSSPPRSVAQPLANPKQDAALEAARARKAQEEADLELARRLDREMNLDGDGGEPGHIPGEW
ncbi:hypothetical protein PLICRDRAFT_39960 [Plicaturopsis crispa FD-325 SS-3]|nr:hypothetical protein PLICRDRAFT_39960 [Plicaturopsis crispa FD-325 SS-3]